MTREETIKWLESLKAEIGKSEHRTLWHYAEAIDMAIEALQAEYEDYEHATLVDIKEPLKVSVVRCKDCRHGEHIQIPLWENRDIDKTPSQFHDFIKCHKFHIKGFNETLYLGDDDYCSHGERREP